MSLLRIENVSKSFGGVRAVRGAAFGIEAHEVTALIGPNGAGKTTLFNIINGFILPDEGKVTFAEEDVTRWPVWRRSRAGMSRTFQQARAFGNLTVSENLSLAIAQDDDLFWRMFRLGGRERSHEREIGEMLEFVGLKKDPGAPATELSYGEQKLFDLARALLNPHSILLLDEPVAGVNPVLRAKLKDILVKLKERRETMLLIEHDMEFVRSVADRVIVMDQGKVLKAGKPEEVLRDPEVLEAYLGPKYDHAPRT